MAATMTDMANATQRSGRPSAARALPARPAQRPAHAAKILTAGISTSLLLGIVTYLGNAAAAAQPSATTVATVPTTVPASVPTLVPTAFPAVPNGQSAVPQVVAVPGAQPALPQVIAVAVPVPVPPPVAAPPPAAPPAVTSGTTSASG